MKKKLSTKRQAIWSDYWKKGIVSSCAAAIASEDSGLDTFWEALSSSIDRHDVLVDLCTGKGAVIKLLFDRLKEQNKTLPKCYGVDFASYELESNVGFKAYPEKVELLLGTSIDSIPLVDDSITGFVSQFGIEYALSENFYQEVARLLRKGGTFHAVIHHQSSVLCNVAREEIQQIETLLNELNLFELASELSSYFALLKNPANAKKLNANSKALSLREEYNQKTALLNKQINAQTDNAILVAARDVCGQSFQVARMHGKKEATQLLNSFQREVDDSLFRSEELLDAALDKTNIQNLVSKFESKFKLNYEISELKSKAQIVAWGLKITRL